MPQAYALLCRRLLALGLLVLSIWMWTFVLHSDVVSLIARQRPVLFGRYSEGQFGALLVLTPILWALAAACWSRRPLGQALINAVLAIVTTLIAIFALTYFAHFFHSGPRYIETVLPYGETPQMQLAGAVRHRPPNQLYELVYSDRPEQVRSYPNAPAGYPDIPVRLTTDANGFRNTALLDRYDVVAVGDSFVACSNVSDAQCWPALLAQATGKNIYNLGVGGSGPPTYLSNYAYFGIKLKPALAVFMIYEGNDFKENVVLEADAHAAAAATGPGLGARLRAHIAFAFEASPVTAGLKRLSEQVFERLGSDRPVPDYAAKIGWMPIAIHGGGGVQYYSFDPKRLLYLNYEREEFRTSPEWRATAKILEQIAALSQAENIQPVFVYAPSTPHVVMPLAEAQIPAEQLRTFLSYRRGRLAEADALKREVFANLDNEEEVVMAFCRERNLECLSLTPALRAATAAGRQTYFSYDQHWTPEGNAVAATAIEEFLRERGLL